MGPISWSVITLSCKGLPGTITLAYWDLFARYEGTIVL